MATAEFCAAGRRKPGLNGGQRPGLSGRRKPGLRLTRRGRVVVAGAAALLVTVAFAAASVETGTGTAQAASHAIPRRVAEPNLTQMTVGPGQSLWSVAENADPYADTRIVIQQIIEINALTGTIVQPGERLWVPRG